MPARDVTLSLSQDGRRRGDAETEPFLFLVLHADRPLEVLPQRFPLADVDEVLLGRGDTTSAAIEPRAEGGHRLVVRVADKRMSSEHARLARVLGGWMLEDARSKNGTFVGGERRTRAELADRDVLELGRTFFLFRSALPAARTKDPTFAPPAGGVTTQSPALVAELELLQEVARSPIPVLLRGESGAGKEVAARLVHALSKRSGAFVPVACGGLPDSMVEMSLLGFEQGAFPGATEGKEGLVRSADRGTILLDELADLCTSAQATLLRVLDAQEVWPIGASAPRKVDLRIITTTVADPEELVRTGHLRADLLSRIQGFTFHIPPLAERREDLGLLVAELLRRHAGPRAPEVRLSPEAARRLLAHPWPGNVRELDRCLSTALVLAGPGPIELEHVEKSLQRPRPPAALQTTGDLASQPTEPVAPADLARASAAHDRPPPPAPPPAPDVPVLEQSGDLWSLAYQGKVTHLADTHGLHYLKYLLEHPGQEVHVLELFSAVRKDEPRARDLGHAGPALDAEAKRAYRRRVEELRAELEEATEWNDAARRERAAAELEAIEEELARGVGLGGRDRVQGTAAERARANLTTRIRKTIKRIEELHPALGHHLSACVKTGTFCAYVPPPSR